MYNNCMSIPKIIEKIKSLSKNGRNKDILSILTIIVISFGSFLLGRNSTTNSDTSQVVVSGVREVVSQKPINKNQKSNTGTPYDSSEQSATQQNIDIYAKGNYTASSRGKKYYPIDCLASQNIKESNKIYFKTASEAESKGYSLSTSCN